MCIHRCILITNTYFILGKYNGLIQLQTSTHVLYKGGRGPPISTNSWTSCLFCHNGRSSHSLKWVTLLFSLVLTVYRSTDQCINYCVCEQMWECFEEEKQWKDTCSPDGATRSVLCLASLKQPVDHKRTTVTHQHTKTPLGWLYTLPDGNAENLHPWMLSGAISNNLHC